MPRKVEEHRCESVEAAWEEEVQRRVRQIDSGEVTTVPWEEVRAKAYARFQARILLLKE